MKVLVTLENGETRRFTAEETVNSRAFFVTTSRGSRNALVFAVSAEGTGWHLVNTKGKLCRCHWEVVA